MLQSYFFWGFLLLPAVFSHPTQLNGWNELLYSDGLFDGSVNDIRVKSTDSAAVLSELKAFLAQDVNANALYSTYRTLFEKNEDKSPLNAEAFKQRLVQIATHNLEANSGKHSWWMGVNQFTDIVPATSLPETISPPGNYVSNASTLVTSDSEIKAPVSVNNVALGKVCPAKDANGGSSQIFAVTAVIETSRAAQKNEPLCLALSEQQVVDCAQAWCSKYSSMCRGSQVENHITYLQYNGCYSWNQYPYANPAAKGTCQKMGATTGLQKDGFATQSGLSDGQLMQLLADKGAAVVSIHISDTLMNTYRKGVYPGSECGSNPPTRTVAVVGYDSEGGQDFWIIKNSWGQKWGEQGFLKLARNGNNVCGILSSATTVNVR